MIVNRATRGGWSFGTRRFSGAACREVFGRQRQVGGSQRVLVSTSAPPFVTSGVHGTMMDRGHWGVLLGHRILTLRRSIFPIWLRSHGHFS